MQNFKDLKLWQKAHRIVLSIYQQTVSFPAQEKFGLTNQIRRAAVSIPANIAEGSVRSSDADFARFSPHRSRVGKRGRLLPGARP
jgi:four helix bundle protein